MHRSLITCLAAYGCTTALAVSIPLSFDLTTSSRTNPNITLPLNLPSNLTLSTDTTSSTSSNHLPSDPYYYDCPDSSSSSTVVLKFYAYGVPLPKKDVAEVVENAVHIAKQHARTEYVPSVRRYRSENVALVLHSKSCMTWGILETSALGIWSFVNTYECVDFDFDVGVEVVDGEKCYGTGALTYFKSVAES